jgi:hypothetical protein
MLWSWVFRELTPPLTLMLVTDSCSALRFLQNAGLLLPPHPTISAARPMSRAQQMSRRVARTGITACRLAPRRRAGITLIG